MNKWTSKSISQAVYATFGRRHLVVTPNSYHTGYEADLLVVRNDLRLMDIEIKISRSDLKADQHKDKWHKTGQWGHNGRVPGEPLQWPRHIWKHYYLIPSDVWKDELYADISEKSGVLLIRDHKSWDGTVTDGQFVTIRRQAKPNKDAKAISATEICDIARLCSVRMWAALDKAQNP